MLHRDFFTLSPLLVRLRCLVNAFNRQQALDQWDALYADDPRFQDEDYEVILATTRSAF